VGASPVSEGEFLAVPKVFTIDIGADGGTLTIDQSQPVTRYLVNGEQVDEGRAWEWIANWHTKRDEALGNAPCPCAPCSWFRSELKLREVPGAE